jgi:hypothetical protein
VLDPSLKDEFPFWKWDINSHESPITVIEVTP